MTPVQQDRFYDAAAGTRGNCLQACLASLLDFPLSAVPNFAEMAAHEWHENLFRWLAMYGLDVESMDEAPVGFAMAWGMSPRGVRHSVVVRDGQVVHDPHPSGAGLTSIQSYQQIVPLTDERAERMRSWT